MDNEGVGVQRLIGWVFPRTEVDWEAAYEDQFPRVYNFFRYRLRNREAAEDLTSLTFEKAWAARHRYRHDLGSFGTWVMTIARRVAIDHARRPKPFVSLEQAGDVAGGPTPEDLEVRRSDAERLAALLDQLSERERELVALKYGAGLTHREIGKLMELSESNVGTILHRIVRSLRADWEAAEGG